MKPQYKTLTWIERTWTTFALMQLSDANIADLSQQVDAIVTENERIYAHAYEARERDRQSFRAQHPRSDWPAHLKATPKHPPQLAERWRAMLARRNRGFREAEEQREEKRLTFIERMDAGRFNAMRKRERAMRRMIREVARERGIELTERATDKRLAELLQGIGAIAVVGEAQETTE